MADKTTWIKLDRNILQWGWYQDANTFRVFMHLLLTANVKPHKFMGVTIGRGEVATSYTKLAETLGISMRNARTAISHLKMTGEVTVKSHPKFTVISIVNYTSYQDNRQAERQASDKQVTSNRHQSKNKRIKEAPLMGSQAHPTAADVSAFCEACGLNVDAERFVDYYEATGWKIGGQPVENWQALCRRWNGTQDYKSDAPAKVDISAIALTEGFYDSE